MVDKLTKKEIKHFKKMRDIALKIVKPLKTEKLQNALTIGALFNNQEPMNYQKTIDHFDQFISACTKIIKEQEELQ